ncbi:MAG: ectoine/hydroxyectoine ABC transporter permease subunit EhuD [Alphaproteobacteria bacterium]|nr:ectoine/hydroxyectoine ABC transporter permease subunit EhuD [Alphaproteobacteria bacterium]
MMRIDWIFALEILPVLAKAALLTLGVTAAGFAISIVLGLFLALLRRSRRRAIAAPAAVFIEAVRGTPLLIQLYFIFYVLPEYGLILPGLATGIVALGIHYGTYTSEVFRAGIDAVPKGQWQAATALGLTPLKAFRHIVLPQAIPAIVPPLGNYLIAMFKDTPLLSAIAVVELMQRAKIIGSESFRYIEPITIVGLFFLAMSLGASMLVRALERWVRIPATG